MDKLPSELILIIFNHLSIKDLLNCQQVCKQFYSVANLVRFKTLKCTELIKKQNFKKSNFRSDFLIIYNQNFFESIVNDVKWFKLKFFHLIINSFVPIDLDKFINNFIELEQLIIKSHTKFKLIRWNFILKSVKTFDIDAFLHSDIQFTLNAPSLNQFKSSSDWNKIKFIHPQSLKCLKINSIYNQNYVENVKQFINLEKLFVSYGDLSNVFSIDLIRSLSSLKEIHYSGWNSYVKLDFLSHFLNDRPNLVLYYHFFKVRLEYDQIPHPTRSSPDVILNFLIQNYHSIDNEEKQKLASLIKSLDYNVLEQNFVSIPEFFIEDRYFNLIQIGPNILNEIQLLSFISKLNYIRQLKFNQSNLKLSFFNQLSNEIFSNIHCLHLIEPLLDIRRGDFDFLFKMQYLTCFKIEGEFDLKFIIDSLHMIYSLNELIMIKDAFKIQIIIFRKNISFIQIIKNDEQNQIKIEKDFSDYQTMLQYLNGLNVNITISNFADAIAD